LAQQRQAHNANHHRRAVTINVGDKVMLSTEHLALKPTTDRTRKLAGKFIGPFTVKRVVNDNAYELDLPPTLDALHSTFNISRLKLYKDGSVAFPDRPQPHARPPPEVEAQDNGSPEYNVEHIVAKRTFRGKTQYLVKWAGYPVEENTWEPEHHLEHAQEKLREFQRESS
jgi:hypothetical protein